MSNNEPPQPNPFLTAYESFVSTTPFVTRSILATQVISYLVSWFLNPYYALANIPHFTLWRLEIYRLLTSPLVNTNLIAVVFAYLSFADLGRRLEASMGSAAFGWFCVTMGLLSNLAFLILATVAYLLTDAEFWLFTSSAGIWIILFAAIAVECSRAPPDTMRKLFLFTVPVRYYPLALYALFALVSASLSLANLMALGLGYAVGHGVHPVLDKLALSTERARQWEEGTLAGLARRPGWIAAQSASGGDAWSSGDGDPEAGMTLPLMRPSHVATEATTTDLPAAGGRTLGGPARRTDARAARLQALDKKKAAGDA